MIFQFTSKKIISLLACISITISCLVIPASAAVTPGQVIEGIGTIATLWDIGNDAYEMWQELNPDKDPSEYPGFNPGGSFSGAGGSRDDAIARYEEYVNGLQTDLGTTTLIDGGVRVYFPCTSYEKGNLTIEDISLGTCSRVYAVNSSSSASSVSFLYDTISVPFACNFTTGMAYASNIVPHTFDSPPYYFHSGTASSGGKIFLLFETTCRIIFIVPADSYVDAVLYAYADCIPIQSIDSLTSQDITINSRPTSIVGDYGIMGDDGSIVKVEGGSLVNESEKLVYSPTTAGEITYTDCVFDYADRSYTLTLEDGSTMKVVYGDENVTIHEGDTIYNVYYLSSDSGSGGSGSDGGGSGDGSVGDAVSGFLGALGDVISGLISGLLSLATKALEALVGLGDLLRQMGEALIGFFGGFTDFLGAVFPFLPEETFTILNLGLILMIAAAVFKKFF